MKKLSWFPLFLGFRNFYTFRKGKKRTMAGAAIAVALSVIPLVVVIEISDGMIEGITRRFIELETGHIQLAPMDDYSVSDFEDLSVKLIELPEVIYASPVYRGTALIYSNENRTGIQIKALDDDIHERDAGFAEYLEIIDGEFNIEEPSSIMLSSKISDELDVGTGDSVKLLTARTMKNGKIILRPEEFTITGIFSTGYYEVDSLTGYINIRTGEKLFRGEGYLSIQCKVTDPYGNMEETADRIHAASDLDVSVSTWYGMQRSMYESLYTTRVVLIFIMAVIMIVASVNITSSMIIMVIERRQDIAILKSCGAGNRQIRMSFILTGLITGLTGAAAGICLGLLISVNVNKIISVFRSLSGLFASRGDTATFSIASASSYYLDKIPVDIDAGKVLAVGAGVLLLSVTAAVLPARKAEKMTPLEIMRKQ